MMRKSGKRFSEKHALGPDPKNPTQSQKPARNHCSARRACQLGGLTALWVDIATARGYAKAGAGNKGASRAIG
jgi:hypothetical protein